MDNITSIDNTTSSIVTLWTNDYANVDANYGPWDSVDLYLGFILRNFHTNEVLPGTIIALKKTDNESTKITLNVYQPDNTWVEIGQNSTVIYKDANSTNLTFKDKYGNDIATTAIISAQDWSNIKDTVECTRVNGVSVSTGYKVELRRVSSTSAPSDTGAIISDIIIPFASSSTAGIMSAGDKSKLDSIKLDSSGNLEIDIDEYVLQIGEASTNASNALSLAYTAKSLAEDAGNDAGNAKALAEAASNRINALRLTSARTGDNSLTIHLKEKTGEENREDVLNTISYVNIPLATTTNAGLMSNSDKTKLDGLSNINAYTKTESDNKYATKSVATTSANGLMSSTDKTKLNSIIVDPQTGDVTIGETELSVLIQNAAGSAQDAYNLAYTANSLADDAKSIADEAKSVADEAKTAANGINTEINKLRLASSRSGDDSLTVKLRKFKGTGLEDQSDNSQYDQISYINIPVASNDKTGLLHKLLFGDISNMKTFLNTSTLLEEVYNNNSNNLSLAYCLNRTYSIASAALETASGVNSALKNTANVNSLFATTTGLNIRFKDQYNYEWFEFNADIDDKFMIVAPDTSYDKFISSAKLADGSESYSKILNLNEWYSFSEICTGMTMKTTGGVLTVCFGINTGTDNESFYTDGKLYMKKRIFM